MTTTSLPDRRDIHLELPSFYRYRVGAIEVTAIHDGMNRRSLEGLVRNASLRDVQCAMEQECLPNDVLPITFTPLVLRTSGRTILIDTGNGNSGAKTAGKFLPGLRAAGIETGDVDTIIISHFHGDHINGLRLQDGSWVYANAEVFVPAREWAFWMDAERAGGAPDALKPTFQAARRVFGPVAKDVRRYEADEEIAPGIQAVAAYGHTPGHMAFSIRSGQDSMMAVSDITNHPALFVRNPDWAGAFDIDPEAARESRRRILNRAAEDRIRLAFYHAPFPAVGRVSWAGDGFRFVPVQWGAE